VAVEGGTRPNEGTSLTREACVICEK